MDSNYKVKNVRCGTPYKKYQFCFGGKKKKKHKNSCVCLNAWKIFYKGSEII